MRRSDAVILVGCVGFFIAMMYYGVNGARVAMKECSKGPLEQVHTCRMQSYDDVEWMNSGARYTDASGTLGSVYQEALKGGAASLDLGDGVVLRRFACGSITQEPGKICYGIQRIASNFNTRYAAILIADAQGNARFFVGSQATLENGVPKKAGIAPYVDIPELAN